MLNCVCELCRCVSSPHQFPAHLCRAPQQLLAIPAEMFACYPDTAHLAVERVERIEMAQDDITQLGALKCRRLNSALQMGVDITKDPGRSVTRAADHYSVCASKIKHRARFLRRVDVAIGEYGYANACFDLADGGVLRSSVEQVRTRAAVDCERCDSAALGDVCNVRAVAMLAVPAGADLERHRHVHRAHHRFEDA